MTALSCYDFFVSVHADHTLSCLGTKDMVSEYHAQLEHKQIETCLSFVNLIWYKRSRCIRSVFSDGSSVRFD